MTDDTDMTPGEFRERLEASRPVRIVTSREEYERLRNEAPTDGTASVTVVAHGLYKARVHVVDNPARQRGQYVFDASETENAYALEP